MNKKLSVVFVWHMHQPNYKDMQTGEYCMPWVRLHGVKDYLDMLLILKDFPSIKQTFNIVPLLIDQLNDYANNNAHDTHSRLTVTNISDLTEKDKQFILDNFFDANYSQMVEPYEQYKILYDKRSKKNGADSDYFSAQEYSDIMAWFNLCWIDPYWAETIPELKSLFMKEKNYTDDDRKKIIDIQRNIIRNIIPTYKQFLKEGKIEICTSPYYHPIMPLLIDYNSARRATPNIALPQGCSGFLDDAKQQLAKSIEKFEEIFETKPGGIWLSEQCLSPETLDLLASMGINWTIADEGILANTLEKEFIRNFRGIIEDPYDLCKTYKYKNNGNEINLLFRDSVLASLISFEYGSHAPSIAANDLYERIKTTQSQLQLSPDKQHLVTIALDGENSWESYSKDGRPFLEELYRLLSEDESLEVTTVSDYLSKNINEKILENIYTGSWINRNFQLWIGDPTKNLAWDYLCKTRQDLISFSEEKIYRKEILNQAWEEIYIAESSDWYWWYGEPNDSGHDDVFDKLFRTHLQNVYKILNKPVPSSLQISLEAFTGKPSKNPKGTFTPKINGIIDNENEWLNAGRIDLPHGPMYKSDKLFDRIFFGNDKENLYFRFDINKFFLWDTHKELTTSQIFVYFYVPHQSKKASYASFMRIKSKSNSLPSACKMSYHFELEVPICGGQVLPPFFAEAMEGYMWKLNLQNDLNYKYRDVLELSIPFEDLGVEPGEKVYFIIINSKTNMLEEIIPLNSSLMVRRPE